MSNKARASVESAIVRRVSMPPAFAACRPPRGYAGVLYPQNMQIRAFGRVFYLSGLLPQTTLVFGMSELSMSRGSLFCRWEMFNHREADRLRAAILVLQTYRYEILVRQRSAHSKQPLLYPEVRHCYQRLVPCRV